MLYPAFGERHALISVFDKTGVDELAKQLMELGFNILSSGGTASYLIERGIEVVDIATIVGEPILDHRVVTLSREIHAALLAGYNAEDLAELTRLGISPIDFVRVDFYPLNQAIADPDATPASIIKMTDIGGPTMVRSAIKGERIVICDPTDIDWVLEVMRQGLPLEPKWIMKLGAHGEELVGQYCLASAAWRQKFLNN